MNRLMVEKNRSYQLKILKFYILINYFQDILIPTLHEDEQINEIFLKVQYIALKFI